MGIFHSITQQFSVSASDNDSLRIIVVAAVALAAICLVAASVKKRLPRHVGWPFALIAVITITSSGLLIGTTLDNFSQSESNGITRRAMHIEYWVCGVELELVDPKTPAAFSVGEGPYYEFDDKIGRFQGLVGEDFDTPTLADFQVAVGGNITSNDMTVPVSDEIVENDVDGDIPDPSGVSRIDKFVQYDSVLDNQIVGVQNGATCGDEDAELNIFAYSLNDDGVTYSQREIEFPSSYIMNDEAEMDDCVIVEFDRPSTKTDRLCENFGTRDTARCQDFLPSDEKTSDCNLRQTELKTEEL